MSVSVLGIGAGLLLALLAGKVLTWLTDPVLAGALTVVLPFGAYSAAEEIGGSGVLAVLAIGLVLNSASYHVLDAEQRLIGSAFWSTIDLLLTSVAFIGTADQQTTAREVAIRMVGAMDERIDELYADGDLDEESAQRWRERCRQIVAAVGGTPETENMVEERAQFRHMRAVNLELHAAAQAEALRLREDYDIDPAAVDRILHLIDHRIVNE